MRMSLAVLLNSLLILSIPTPLVAKGKTVKITIKGADLKTPIAITDRKILANFQVWTGPGTSTADRQSLIIDWSQGPVRKAPESLRRYQVSFHTDPNEQIVYVVYYAFSPGAEQALGTQSWCLLIVVGSEQSNAPEQNPKRPSSFRRWNLPLAGRLQANRSAED